jgi:Acetamidase/Formamidase family
VNHFGDAVQQLFAAVPRSRSAGILAPILPWTAGVISSVESYRFIERFDWRLSMPKTAFQLNMKKPPEDAVVKTHNRWHPDIPFVETFKPGAEFRVE